MLFSYVLRSCNLSDKASELRGQIKILEADVTALRAENKLAKEAYEKTIAAKDLEIEEWRKDAAEASGEISEGNEKIKDLKEQIAKLNPADKDALIVKQYSLIETLERNLTLSARVIEDKDKEILAWEVKFNSCQGLIPGLEREIERLNGLVDTQKKLIKDLELDLRVSRSGGRIKTILIGAAAGYFIYKEASK